MRLLIVGTQQGPISEAGRIAFSRGARVAYAESIEQALTALRNGNGADLLMVDVAQDIATLIESLRAERIAVPVVACGIGTDARTAVQAIRAGAKEYVPLPPDAELIAAVLEAVADESQAVVFRDPAMTRVLQLADQIAGSTATVLIAGESGTGKEVVARYIHRKSKRAAARFVSVNCAAIPDNLLESELFGHEKGAFTGAVARRIGKFEEANGGTLLLDEISEMDLRLQAKLLRAVQEREIDRVGGTEPVKVDIRLLATTNRDLLEMVRQGKFREDLYFRLNVVTLKLPRLADRPADIPVLAQHFAQKYCTVNGFAPKRLGDEALSLLSTHTWPGNVRELENTIHRAVLLSPDDIVETMAVSFTPTAHTPTPRAAGSDLPLSAEPGTFRARTVAEVERDLILDTLGHCLGNRTHAANILGISIRTLRNKLKQYSDEGIAVPLPRDGSPVYAA
jgi:DNA-binding NtrC family response regulator